MNIEASLKEAIETGEVIKVRYHGESQPGALREIAPQKNIALLVNPVPLSQITLALLSLSQNGLRYGERTGVLGLG